MSARDLSPEDLEGLLHTSAQRFAEKKFAEAWTPCYPAEDAFLTLATFVLAMVAPVAFVVWVLS